MATNREIVRLLDELALLTELDEGDPNAFRVRAYQNARRAVEGLGREAETMSVAELASVRGIGKSIAGRIREFVDTGRIGRLEELRDRHPPGQLELMQVPGLGPKTVGLLAEALDVTDLAGLRASIEDGRLASLPGLGPKTVENLLTGIEQLGVGSKSNRRYLYRALPVAERLVSRLEQVPGVGQTAYAGSLRRFAETVGDLDVLVATDDPAPVNEAFRGFDEFERVTDAGGTRSSAVTHDGLQVDLRVVEPSSFGAAMLYFTGSKAHNIRLRQRALKRGWSLNEYGLVEDETGRVVAATTEEEIYSALSLPWIPPELREDDGEVESAEAGELPALVTLEDLRGDLHDHTDLSGDGRHTLEELVEGCVGRGLQYLATTDHAENLSINGVSREALLAQRRRLRDLEQCRGDIALLHGAELNIGPAGELDYDAAFRAGFDWLVASVHSHFRRDVRAQTARIVAAIRDPSVTAIGHLTGRMLGKRGGIELDLEEVFDAAAETGTAVEINAALRRLDAAPEVVREGRRRGVTFVISTDAHAPLELERARFGVAAARRAGLDSSQVANTWELERFRRWIDDVRGA